VDNSKYFLQKYFDTERSECVFYENNFQKQKISGKVFQKFFVFHVATWTAEASSKTNVYMSANRRPRRNTYLVYGSYKKETIGYEKPPFLGPFRRHSFVWKITIIHTHLPSIAYTVFLCNPLVDKGSQGAPFGAFL